MPGLWGAVGARLSEDPWPEGLTGNPTWEASGSDGNPLAAGKTLWGEFFALIPFQGWIFPG